MLALGIISFGQIKDGTNVIGLMGNIYVGISKGESSSAVNPTLISKTRGGGLNSEITYGKIKSNHLISYGLIFGFGTDKQSSNSITTPGESKNHRYNIGPTVSYQKFYSLTNKLYYSPISKLSVVYQHSKQDASVISSIGIQKGIAATFEFNPFSITFSKSPKTNFLFTIGSIWINYTRTKSYYEPILNDSKTISSQFTVNAQISGIGFGIQKLF